MIKSLNKRLGGNYYYLEETWVEFSPALIKRFSNYVLGLFVVTVLVMMLTFLSTN